jgi:hypothetical protein
MYTKVTIKRVSIMGYRDVYAHKWNTKVTRVGSIYNNMYYDIPSDRWYPLKGTIITRWKSQVHEIINYEWRIS